MRRKKERTLVFVPRVCFHAIGVLPGKNKKPNLTTEIAEYAEGIMAKGSRPRVQGKMRT
jgi:hypothetical protein